MRKYQLYLKSHCEAPDYEDMVEANSEEEAIKKFLEDLALREWTEEMIKDEIALVDDNVYNIEE